MQGTWNKVVVFENQSWWNYKKHWNHRDNVWKGLGNIECHLTLFLIRWKLHGITLSCLRRVNNKSTSFKVKQEKTLVNTYMARLWWCWRRTIHWSTPTGCWIAGCRWRTPSVVCSRQRWRSRCGSGSCSGFPPPVCSCFPSCVSSEWPSLWRTAGSCRDLY